MTSTKRSFPYLPRRVPLEVVSSLVLCALAYWAFKHIDFELLRRHLLSLANPTLLYALALNAIVFAVHGYRLKSLISERFTTAFQIVNLGAVLNIILPFRLGDLARIYMARQYFALAATRLLAAAVIEKLFDLTAVALLCLAVIVLRAMDLIPARVVIILLALTAIIIAGFATFRRADWVHRLIGLLPEALREPLMAFKGHLAISERLRVTVCTLVIWAGNVGVVLLAFRTMLPASEFGLFDAIAVLVITALAVAVPGAPAGLGIFEAGVVAYLTQVHQISTEMALACAVAFHVLVVVPPMVFMLLGLARGLVYQSSERG